MRVRRLGFVVVLLVAASASACGSGSQPPTPLEVADVSLQSKVMGRQMLDLLVTPPGGGKGRAGATDAGQDGRTNFPCNRQSMTAPW